MRTMEKIMKITESGVGGRGVSGLLFVSLQGFGRAVEGASWGAVGERKRNGLMGIEKKGESRGRERGRTEDELLGWREHVKAECDFVLVSFAL
jgi:hypothetical protein